MNNMKIKVSDNNLATLPRSERLIEMMDYLERCGETHISELCKRYDKSPTTIKRDLFTLKYIFDLPFENKERKYIKLVVDKEQ